MCNLRTCRECIKEILADIDYWEDEFLRQADAEQDDIAWHLDYFNKQREEYRGLLEDLDREV